MSEEEAGSAPEQVEETPAEQPQEEAPAEEPKEEEAPKEEAPKAAAPSCSGECPCKMFTEPFEKSPFFNDMKEIFLWKDLMKSLAVFCAVNVFFVLLLCYDFTVLGLLCWIAFFLTIVGLIIDVQRVIAHFKGEAEPETMFNKFPETVTKVEIPEGPIKGFFELVTSLIIAFLNVCLNAIFVKDICFSLGMLGGFLVLIYLAAKWGVAGMLYAGILFCFIWFRLYQDHKEGIDNLFAKLKEQVNKLIETIKEKINKPKAQ